MSTTSDNFQSEPPQPVAECGSPRLMDAAGAPVASPTLSGTSTSTASQAVVTPPAMPLTPPAQSAGGSPKICGNPGCGKVCAGTYCSAACRKAASPVVLKSQSFKDLCDEVKSAPAPLIEGFMPQKSAGIIVGDSGLGKTPLLVQLGLCVAAEIPFLGMRTKQTIVLYLDYENSSEGFESLMVKLQRFLGLSEIPDNFRRFPAPEPTDIEEEIKALRLQLPDMPILVIADSMRGFDPKAETKSDCAMDMLSKLEKWAKAHDCAALLIHHLRKDNDENPLPPLEDTDVLEWLTAASGVRALINQTTTRFGVDKIHASSMKTEAELIIKGHYKIRGNLGPWYLKRVREEGEPIGYEVVTGLSLINAQQQFAYARLPNEFRFGDLEKVSGMNARYVADWLRTWKCALLVKQSGTGKDKRYIKDPRFAVEAVVEVAKREKKIAEKAAKKPKTPPKTEKCSAAAKKLNAALEPAPVVNPVQPVRGLCGEPLQEVAGD